MDVYFLNCLQKTIRKTKCALIYVYQVPREESEEFSIKGESERTRIMCSSDEEMCKV